MAGWSFVVCVRLRMVLCCVCAFACCCVCVFFYSGSIPPVRRSWRGLANSIPTWVEFDSTRDARVVWRCVCARVFGAWRVFEAWRVFGLGALRVYCVRGVRRRCTCVCTPCECARVCAVCGSRLCGLPCARVSLRGGRARGGGARDWKDRCGVGVHKWKWHARAQARPRRRYVAFLRYTLYVI